MPLVKTASAGGCPLACWGRPVKPFTLMGEEMLVTVGAVIPGGVLPPEGDNRTGETRYVHYFWRSVCVCVCVCVCV